MQIVTAKDFFSEESIGGRKADKRGRGRRPSLPIPSNMLATVQPLGGSKPQPYTRPTRGDRRRGPEQEKTTFYQAARSKQATPQTPTAPMSPIDPELGQPLLARPIEAPPSLPTPPLRPRLQRPPLNRMQPSMPPVQRSFVPQPSNLPAAPRGKENAKLRIIPLGGLEEIGKNMTVFEYGDDIVIVDMGFLFPDSEMLGVDYIIPDVSYLDDKKHKIRGVIITHGHMDHVGAIPYIIERLGFPPMYGTPISLGIAKGRLEEFNLVGRGKLINIEAEKDVLQLGSFRVRPFRLIHSIPGAIGLEIETPNGRVVYATDWKFDYTPASGEPVDFRILAGIGSRGVDLLFSDSTNVDRPGHSVSEKTVEAAIMQSVQEAKGRVIVSMFASDLNRMQMALNAAAATGRKVLVQGRSMQQNMEMAINLKAMNAPQSTIISERELGRFNEHQILVLATGAQGQENSALSRMAKGEHKTIKIRKGDTVILSASPIPGNERSITAMMELLYKAGANVVYNKILDVHTSGHAYQEDLKLMVALMRPKQFFPLHGERAKRLMHGKLAVEAGSRPDSIIIADNGSIVEMDHTGKVEITNESVPAGHVIVDGLGVGDIGEVVLRDRMTMAHDGIFVVVSVFDTKKGAFASSPDIISRGFIYMRENERFISDVRTDIKHFLTKATAGKKRPDFSVIKAELRDYISKLLYQKTERDPIVIPVVIEI
jgi:ribonuclease J